MQLKKLLHLYALCAENGEVPFVVPDYNKRVMELAKLENSSDSAFLDGLYGQVNALRKKGDLSDIKDELKAEFTAQAKVFNTVEQNYIALGGKTDADFSPYVKAMKHCGDLAGTVNFMTVVRESGFAEFV